MGIDIFAGPPELREQEKGWAFSIERGHIGYLREAYHGEPYATHYFVQEAFEQPDGIAIPAHVLRDRLPRTLKLVRERERTLYKASEEDTQRACQSYVDFVELCESLERKTGNATVITASY